MSVPSPQALHASQRLSDLRDAIAALASLKPGEGYDAIGEELCALIFQDYTPQEKDDILRLLDERDSTIIPAIRRASIDSEMEMEKSVIEKILSTSRSELLPPEKSKSSLVDKFRHVTRFYPYSWGFSRAEEQLGLIKEMTGREIDAQRDAFLLHGRTMLPWSGLSLHLLTGAPVVWIDRFADSAAYAQRLVAVLEDLNILEKGAFRVVREDETKAVAGALSMIRDKTVHSFVLDKDYDVSAIYSLFRTQNVQSLMLTETHGLTQLMYPPYDLAPLAGQFNLKAVLIPHHAAGTKRFEPGVKVIEGSKKDVFLSTMYFEIA